MCLDRIIEVKSLCLFENFERILQCLSLIRVVTFLLIPFSLFCVHLLIQLALSHRIIILIFIFFAPLACKNGQHESVLLLHDELLGGVEIGRLANERVHLLDLLNDDLIDIRLFSGRKLLCDHF